MNLDYCLEDKDRLRTRGLLKTYAYTAQLRIHIKQRMRRKQKEKKSIHEKQQKKMRVY